MSSTDLSVVILNEVPVILSAEFVILNEEPVILSGAKNLGLTVILSGAKNLIK